MAHTQINVSPEERQRRKALADLNAQKRKDRLKAARVISAHTKPQWLTLVLSCCGKCPRCLKWAEKLVKDHIIPIYQGGSDGIENIQPLCFQCNSSKGPETTNWLQARAAVMARWAKHTPTQPPRPKRKKGER